MGKYNLYILLFFSLLFTGCREDELVVLSKYELLPISMRDENNFDAKEPIGMYVLNEGNMGSNKASIDYVDFVNAYYIRNIYSERNPNVIKELGDVGNDIQIYGNKLYAVVNCSHKVEVMDVRTCKRLGQIDIPNCRYIRFAKGNAYVSSYVGPVSIQPNVQLGAVFKIDTVTLKVTDKVTVGYQPDELVIIDDYLYVANSGGYRAPLYDSTISVVDIHNMQQVRKIPLAINLHGIRQDTDGKLWVSSRGDGLTVPSRLFVLEMKNGKMTATDSLDIPCSEMAVYGDSLYFYSNTWNQNNAVTHISYGIIHTKTKQLVTQHFITDGTEADIKMPYGIAVNPYNGDIYITDAKNYVSSGTLHCYSREGVKKWSVRTGDIPAHMVFVYK